MIITLKIDLDKSGNLFHELLDNEDVEIVEIKSNSEPIVIVGPLDKNGPSFTRLFKETVSPLVSIKDEIEAIGNIYDRAYDDKMEDWFDDSKYWYFLDILFLSLNFLMVFPEPFIKRLFHRKCFMVLKDFRNIRRCYQF